MRVVIGQRDFLVVVEVFDEWVSRGDLVLGLFVGLLVAQQFGDQ